MRLIEPGDWDRIGEIEAAEYGARGLAEGRELLKSRWGKETSFVLESEGRVDGYVIALPYPLDTGPDPAIAERVVHRSSNLHLHDIVVSEELRGRGWAGRMTGRLVERARRSGYQRISLVALGGVTGFWAGQGFESRPDVPLPDGYGPGAVYMSRVIADEERA
ncbi:GNAT family N-acetyltransferase [Streptomyces sp. ID05-26A]|nr:GNAT family N-acetyltransferase [Streptomyces sp. ID05-26A]